VSAKTTTPLNNSSQRLEDEVLVLKNTLRIEG